MRSYFVMVVASLKFFAACLYESLFADVCSFLMKGNL